MRVLVSGAFNPAFEALPEYLVAALRSLGHEVAAFDHRAFLLPGRIRARSAFLDRLDRRRLNAALVARARAFRPAHVIVNQGMTLGPATIRAIRDLGARVVNWFSDHPAEFEQGFAAAPAYDAFHLGSSWAAARHRERGHLHASWLPFACDPATHRPPLPGERRTNSGRPGRVVLVGSHYPERQVLLRHLAGLPVDVWGPGWDRASGDPHVGPMLRGGALRPAAWRAIYGAAAAVLNIHYGVFGPREASGDMASTRLFEIAACGAPQIVDRRPDVVALFHEGTELLAFSDGEELRARVLEALADRERAAALAAAARSAALARHTYAHRARVLLGEAAFAAGTAGDTAVGTGPRPLAAAGGSR
jgi:spore maturation protein CgeB